MLNRMWDKLMRGAKATIKPQSLVLPKDRFERDENHYHYRYPSPASSPVQEEDVNAYDYRLGYKDSVHDIRPFEHDPMLKQDEREYIVIQPDIDPKKRAEGGLISYQEEFGAL